MTISKEPSDTDLMDDKRVQAEAFFYSERHQATEGSARRVLSVLFEFYRPASVVDLGCGVGTWLSVCQKQGIQDVLGIDSAYVDPAHLVIPRDQFLQGDLANLSPPDRKFDLAISLEAAEHLPPESADRFVEVLVRLAPVVLFSAAIPGQGGYQHINEQWPTYWAEKFRAHGLSHLDIIRPRIWDDDSVLWWYRQNILVFASPSSFERHERAAELKACSRGEVKNLVHPTHYDLVRQRAEGLEQDLRSHRKLGVRAAGTALFRAISRYMRRHG